MTDPRMALVRSNKLQWTASMQSSIKYGDVGKYYTSWYVKTLVQQLWIVGQVRGAYNVLLKSSRGGRKGDEFEEITQPDMEVLFRLVGARRVLWITSCKRAEI